MRKIFITTCIILISALLMFSGCQKENTAITSEDANNASLASANDLRNHKDECRLIFGTNTDPTGNADFTFHYNKKGLADVWNIENYGDFILEYDVRGKLKKSTLTQNGEVTGTTYFFYNKGNKVEREVSYYGTTTDTSDIEYFHYDTHGDLIKVQSFLNDYVAIGKYTPDGNLSESKLFFSGVPVYTAIYKYNKPFKNPYLAVPGIDNLFPYYTPMDLFYGKLRWASLKQIAYDENGNPIIQFEYDPSKTVWKAGPRDYPALVNYFDLLSGSRFPYKFEFENCEGGGCNESNQSQITATSTAFDAGKMNLMLLKHGRSKSMKEQVKEFRQQLKNIKNSGTHN